MSTRMPSRVWDANYALFRNRIKISFLSKPNRQQVASPHTVSNRIYFGTFMQVYKLQLQWTCKLDLTILLSVKCRLHQKKNTV